MNGAGFPNHQPYVANPKHLPRGRLDPTCQCNLVDGWTNPFQRICLSKWIIIRRDWGKNENCLKPPSRSSSPYADLLLVVGKTKLFAMMVAFPWWFTVRFIQLTVLELDRRSFHPDSSLHLNETTETTPVFPPKVAGLWSWKKLLFFGCCCYC